MTMPDHFPRCQIRVRRATPAGCSVPFGRIRREQHSKRSLGLLSKC